jgi:hypothetical protein
VLIPEIMDFRINDPTEEEEFLEDVMTDIRYKIEPHREGSDSEDGHSDSDSDAGDSDEAVDALQEDLEAVRLPSLD